MQEGLPPSSSDESLSVSGNLTAVKNNRKPMY